jgi:tryptophan synthase alpha chain
VRVSSVPVAVGFGVSNQEHAAAVARYADGVIVGSALVEILSRHGLEAAGDLVRSLRSVM